MRFSLKLAPQALFHPKLELPYFLDVQHLKYATDPVEKHTAAISKSSALDFLGGTRRYSDFELLSGSPKNILFLQFFP